MNEIPKSVVAVFVNPLGEVLAISRRGKPEDLGLVGGKVDVGDASPEEALIREVGEEVGVVLTAFDFIRSRRDEADEMSVCWCYLATAWMGEPRAMEPNTIVGWFRPERLLEPNCVFREYNRAMFEGMGLVKK